MSSAWARYKASQIWCCHETKNIRFDGVLAETFAKMLDEVVANPPTPQEKAAQEASCKTTF